MIAKRGGPLFLAVVVVMVFFFFFFLYLQTPHATERGDGGGLRRGEPNAVSHSAPPPRPPQEE
jgi:hypothetical protein